MAMQLHQPTRFQLPARAGTKPYASNELPTRLSLIDRIANLKEIETIRSSNNAATCQLDVYVRPNLSASLRELKAPQFLYSVNCNKVTINGLDHRTRQQVLDHGWGEILSGRLVIHMPRDNEELDIVWGLLLRAYNLISIYSAQEAGTPMVPNWGLPRFSRTSLQ